jgi:hypothetical protein
MRHRSFSLKLRIFYHDIPRLASRQTVTVLERAHLRNSPPSLLMIGNNCFKYNLPHARGLTRPRPFANPQTVSILNVQGAPAGQSCF